jgi:hypothetical protein
MQRLFLRSHSLSKLLAGTILVSLLSIPLTAAESASLQLN